MAAFPGGRQPPGGPPGRRATLGSRHDTAVARSRNAAPDISIIAAGSSDEPEAAPSTRSAARRSARDAAPAPPAAGPPAAVLPAAGAVAPEADPAERPVPPPPPPLPPPPPVPARGAFTA